MDFGEYEVSTQNRKKGKTPTTRSLIMNQEYDKLRKDDIEITVSSECDEPKITESNVRKALEEMDTSKLDVNGD